ncbi:MULTISPECIES: response regulator [Robinsoniella]|uniref:response regulator transcription factor n=1 Tax=Robinsoniella TaxID=588605 RepID=UPI000486E660|nr:MULTISPECIES: response regulator [Robinsoniella]
MGLYSVMLVDDEEAVRQAIAKKLDWEQIGFQVIATAENGEEALELAEKLRPDVVMTDIKMPFMDGLTFCHRLKEGQKNIRLVIFSGFDEFDYAKEAIKLEVEEYVLKPIDSEQLSNVFARIRKSLDDEVDAKRNQDKLFRYYLQSLPIMKEQFMAGLLEGRILNEQIKEMNRTYEVNLESDFYAVAVFRTDAHHQELLNLSLKQIVYENMDDEFDIRSFVYLDAVVVILMLKGEKHFAKAIRELDQICKSAHKLLEVNVTAGIGQMVKILGDLMVSYRGAQDAVDYRVLLEPNQAIFIKDIQPFINHDFRLEEQDIQEVMKAVKLGNKQELKVAVDALIYKLKNSNISLPRFQVAIMELVTGLAKLGRSYDLNLEEVFDGEINFYQDVGKFESLDVLGERLYQTCFKFHSFIHQERIDSTKMLTEKAKQYIEENYAKSTLSVDVICANLGVSAAYFSTIFKRETGQNFVKYLTNIRMEVAIEMLNNTQDQTYVIAGKVGYTEPNYFSYVFKKKYGVSPSKYRMSIMEQNES